MYRDLWREVTAKGALALCVFAVAYYFAYRYGMSYTVGKPAPFWFPDAVLLCALLKIRPRWWWLPLLVTLPIRFALAIPFHTEAPFLLFAFSIGCAKPLLAALLLRRFVNDPLRFASVRDFGVYCLVAVILVPVSSAYVGAVVRESFGSNRDYWISWQQWFLGDALAALIVTPFLFYWVLRPPNLRGISAGRCTEALVLTAALGGSISLAFQPTPDRMGFMDWHFYVPIAVLVWAAVRFGVRGATGAVALLSYLAITDALTGRGQFAGLSSAAATAMLQEFLLLRAGPLLLVSVLIEQTRQVEVSLRESQRRFRSLADTAPVLVWMSGVDGLCDFFNKGWLDFTGRSLEQERGNGWADGVHPEDMQRCLEIYRGSFQVRKSFEMEYRLRRHDGDYRWTLDRGVPRFTATGEFLGYIGCSIDVTDRRHQEAALRRSEERYRGLVETQTDFVCRFLDDTTLTFVNEAYCRFLGRSREELLGTPLLTLLPERVHDTATARIEQAASQGVPGEWECESTSNVGLPHWQHWVCQAIPGSGVGFQEFQAIGHDITDRKRAEVANRNLAHTARLATFGELTAMVAHEITQPLCTILSNAETAELLLKKQDPPVGEILEILGDIREADLRADQTIRSIRALSRQREMQLQPLDLNQTIADVLRLTAGDALYRRVQIQRRFAEDLPLVMADRSYLEQVLLNLVVNAMDAMKDSPEAARRLTVQTEPGGAQGIEVSVIDTGHGIPSDKMAHLFDSFFSTKPEGMGLGLSIARSIVQAHNGRIWVENREEGGAIFHFTVQAAR